jgi:hypothetical protein
MRTRLTESCDKRAEGLVCRLAGSCESCGHEADATVLEIFFEVTFRAVGTSLAHT